MAPTDFMVDLETLSSSPTACIVQIGAVAFDRKSGECGEAFKVNVVPDFRRFDVSADTVAWWMCQSDEARNSVFGDATKCELRDALNQLCEHFKSYFPISAPQGVWALPASFDLPILDNAFSLSAARAPWPYWTVRCCRTLFDIAGIEKDCIKPEDIGLVSHDATADCIAQAKTVSLAFSRIALTCTRRAK